MDACCPISALVVTDPIACASEVVDGGSIQLLRLLKEAVIGVIEERHFLSLLY